MPKHTKIHTTKKLEQLVRKLIVKDENITCGILGKWNANLFFVNRKKCWLISNAKTQYNVILTNIKSSDFKQIDTIFKNAFYNQLISDNIIIDYENISDIIGKLQFLPTNNDRKTTGFQNQRIMDLEYWKHEFKTLENMPIKDLVNRMNQMPIHLGEGRKMSDYTNAIDEIKNLLTHNC